MRIFVIIQQVFLTLVHFIKVIINHLKYNYCEICKEKTDEMYCIPYLEAGVIVCEKCGDKYKK